jgi:hypothetical protein
VLLQVCSAATKLSTISGIYLVHRMNSSHSPELISLALSTLFSSNRPFHFFLWPETQGFFLLSGFEMSELLHSSLTGAGLI